MKRHRPREHQRRSVSHDTVSRRSFLASMSASTAGLVLAPYFLPSRAFAGGLFEPVDYLATVALTQGDNYGRTYIKQKVQHLFESIDGIGDVVKAGDRVAIKINLTGGSGSAYSPALQGVPITESMWTHPEVVRAVGELLIDAGVKGSDIYLVEALWDNASYNNFGYLNVQQALGAQMVNLNDKAPYPDFIDLPVGEKKFFYTSFKLNRILSEVDVFVSIPKMKQHYEAGFTGSLKNHVGITPKTEYQTPTNTGRRERIHTEGGSSKTHLPRSISDLNLARPVHLAVIDGIRNARGGEGVWNATFRLAEDHVLLAGKDPVATDSVSAYLMGLNPEAPRLPLPAGGEADNHLDLLHQRGVGTNQLSEVHVVGDGAGLMTSVSHQEIGVLPTGYELYQNFPNPFNPSTTFMIHLPSGGPVSVKVYSLTGQEIETLVDGPLEKGLHELRWTPVGIASGTYFCEMRAGEIRARRKMVYQK